MFKTVVCSKATIGSQVECHTVYIVTGTTRSLCRINSPVHLCVMKFQMSGS